MLCVSAIISLRNLPTTALLGLQSITFFLAAAVCFFIPVALACAELASGFPEKGGVYLWVREAFGEKLGFLAVWLQWVESVVWLPTILSFIAATTAYLFEPLLEHNKLFLISIMLFVLWGTTFLNFRGLKTSSLFSSLGVILGTLIPGIVLIALSFSHFSSQNENLLTFSFSALSLPDEINTFVTFTAILLGFGGMEIPAYHVQNVKNPQRNYPRAVLLATIIILAIYILGTLAIANVVPKTEISLIAGPMQAFHYFFKNIGLQYATPILAFFTLIGSLALLNTWILGPSKGLLSCTEEGVLPVFFKRTNKAGIPTTLLYIQGICGSVLISLFILNPSIKAAYWMIGTLAAQLYLIMYFIVFIALIKLRHSHPHIPRSYHIPGGKCGVWLVGGLGGLASLFALGIGFIRPTDVPIHYSAKEYASILLLGMLSLSVLPLIPLLFRRKRSHN